MSDSVIFGFGRFRIRVLSDKYTLNLFLKEYGGFSGVEDKNITEEVLIKKDPTLPVEIKEGLWPLNIYRRENNIYLSSIGFKGYFDLLTFNGELLISPFLHISVVENFFRVYFSYFLLYKDALLLHSAAIKLGDVGYLFVGQSGSGKSTIARLLKDEGEIFSDDLVAVDIDGRFPKLLSTPFRGVETLWLGKESKVKLHKVFFLDKSNINKILPAERGYAVARLFANVPFVNSDEELIEEVLEKVNSLLQKVDYRILRFRNDESVKEVLL